MRRPSSYLEKADGVQVERREVRWAAAYFQYMPTDIPCECQAEAGRLGGHMVGTHAIN